MDWPNRPYAGLATAPPSTVPDSTGPNVSIRVRNRVRIRVRARFRFKKFRFRFRFKGFWFRFKRIRVRFKRIRFRFRFKRFRFRFKRIRVRVRFKTIRVRFRFRFKRIRVRVRFKGARFRVRVKRVGVKATRQGSGFLSTESNHQRKHPSFLPEWRSAIALDTPLSSPHPRLGTPSEPRHPPPRSSRPKTTYPPVARD